MIKKVINAKSIKEADVVLVSTPYEKTASSHKGTVHGPAQVVKCLDTQIEFFDRKYKIEVTDFVKTAHLNLSKIKSFSPEKTFKTIKENCLKLVKQDKFVFLLGGEHSVSYGLLSALSAKYKTKDVTILQIDAHCDLRDDDSDYSAHPSPFAHSTVMRRASELGYSIVQVGVRSYSKDEYEYFNNPKNKVKTWQWGLGDKPKVEEVLKSIKTKNVYLSVDIDGFDPSVMPGTGTPVPDGLKWKYGTKLITKLIEKFNLVGADVVEVSPVKDSVITEYSAAQLVYSIITEKFRKKLK
ncbi:MAG: agmatinase [Candidatus Paceibacterota bacterium]|jgi:agmatinase